MTVLTWEALHDVLRHHICGSSEASHDIISSPVHPLVLIRHIENIALVILMIKQVVISRTSYKLLLFGLVCGTHSIRPQVWIFSILRFHLSCLELTLLVIGHWHICILFSLLILVGESIHLGHFLLEYALNFTFIGFCVVYDHLCSCLIIVCYAISRHVVLLLFFKVLLRTHDHTGLRPI